jgi:arginase
MKHDNLSFYEREERHAPVTIIEIPLELGSDERGLADAPSYLLNSDLETVVTDAGAEMISNIKITRPSPAQVEISGSAKYVDTIAKVGKRTATAVQRAIARGDTIIALGGDHSAALGTIMGAATALGSQKTLGVIWIDAHADCNTHETSITGNVHGQVAAAAMGFGHPLLTKIGRHVLPEHFVSIGLKDLDLKEIEFMRREGVHAVTMLDIAERGLSRAILAIQALQRRVDAVWISMDMDAIDVSYAPGVGMPNDGGLTRREVLSLTQYIGKSCPVIGFDIVEVSPQKDVRGMTARLALEISARLLGSEWTWYTEYIDEYRRTNVSSTRQVP